MTAEADHDDSRLQRLIDACADGELAGESIDELLARARESEAVRRRLARAVVLQRLLTALGRGPVSSRAIMDAVAARGARRTPEPAPRRSAPRTTYHPAMALAILLILATAGAGLFWLTGARERPRRTPAPRAAAPLTARPGSAVSGGRETFAPATPDGAAQVPTVTRVETGPTAPPAPFSCGLPLALPEPPPGEDLAPPTGDGSSEPGFVPPSPGWPETPARHGDAGGPVPPVLWVKAGIGRDAAATQGDLDALMASVEEQLGLRYGTALQTLDTVTADPSRNPVLYLSGHYHFTFTTAQRAMLRRLMLSGGMVIFNAALGSKPFYDSARRELRLILPEMPLQRLGDDHPLYHAYYDVDRVAYAPAVRDAGATDDRPWLEGITLSCRTAAVVSRWGLSAGWVSHRGEGFRTYAPDDAKRLGINLFSYAMAVRAWTRQSPHTARFTDDTATGGSRLFVAQIMHSGQWRTRYEALALLLHNFNRRTDVPVTLRTRTLELTDPNVFNAPLLYLTGHEHLRLPAPDIDALRRYLANGGFLFAEACCGRQGFDRSFRALMNETLPDHPLQPIPADARLFRTPNRIELLAVTPSLGARTGSLLMPPRLEGVKIGPNYAVIYSPYGLAGGWEMSQVPYADGYEDPDALKLGENILMYAITQ